VKKNNGVFWGVLLVLFGILFLLDNFYVIDFANIVSTFWPVILIAIGIKMLMDRRNGRSHQDNRSAGIPPVEAQKEFVQSSFSENNVFGDVILKVKTEKFSAGSVNNVFGDIKIDLSESKPDGDMIKLFTSGVFGDITVIAPAGIPLRVKANSVAGDITVKGNKKEGLFPNLNYQDTDYEQAEQKLTIQSSLVFGSINIY
jgi:predicted membrane protein